MTVSTWQIIEEYLQLPGGMTTTIHPQQTTQSLKYSYNLPNLHGDTLLTTDGTGTNTSTGTGPLNAYVYDPFGNPTPGSTNPKNADSGSYGWEGSNQKITETSLSLNPIQMGARVYLPTLGRFTGMDPIPGGNANPYVYPTDPVNGSDLSGEFSFFGFVQSVTHVVASVVHFLGSLGDIRAREVAQAVPQVRAAPRAAAKTVRHRVVATAVAAATASGSLSAAKNIVKALRLNSFQPLDWYHSGPFDNNEGLLPPGGQYLEHDIDPWIHGIGRGAERAVIDMNNGRAWLTKNHYQNFTELLDEGGQNVEQGLEDVGPML